MRSKIICFIITLSLVVSIMPFSAFAAEPDKGTQNEDTCCITIDTSSGLDKYEKLVYLYATERLEDGTYALGITDDINKIPSNRDYNWNVAVLLYAERLSSLYYRITAEAYHPSVLITSFHVNFNYGDGYTSGTVVGINQPPYMFGGYSFYSIATAYHSYSSSGSYSISLNSVTIRVCDVIDPSVTELAWPFWSNYTFNAS